MFEQLKPGNIRHTCPPSIRREGTKDFILLFVLRLLLPLWLKEKVF
jgi:hypothetical protein